MKDKDKAYYLFPRKVTTDTKHIMTLLKRASFQLQNFFFFFNIITTINFAFLPMNMLHKMITLKVMLPSVLC